VGYWVKRLFPGAVAWLAHRSAIAQRKRLEPAD
jgi:hypothetical protein